MAHSEWIKLHLHPDDNEILRLAELTGSVPELVFCAVIRWFWHIDQKCDTCETGVMLKSVDRIMQWQSGVSLAEAMTDEFVGWLELDEETGNVRISGFDKHFGRSAKRRAQEAKRKASARCPQNVRTSCGQNAPQEPRTKNQQKKDITTLAQSRASSDSASKKRAAAKELEDAFGRFWSAYPRKVGKKVAKTALGKALKDATLAEIMDGLDRYTAHIQRENTEERFVAHPATWLNHGRWSDEAATSTIDPWLENYLDKEAASDATG